MLIDTLQQLQDLVRIRRQELSLTQQDLASRAGVSRKWVSEFERGKAQSELPTVMRVLAILGLSVQVNPIESRHRPEPPAATADGLSTGTVDLDRLLEGKFDG